MLKDRIKHLTEELELEMPKGDKENRTFSMILNPQTTIEMRDLSPGFSLKAPIGPCQANKREELFIYLMRANFLGQGTGGARIGLDADEKLLTLSYGFSYEVNDQVFKESVEDFVNYLNYWKDAIATFERET